MRVVMNAVVRVRLISRLPNLLLVSHKPLRRDGTEIEVFADHEIHSWDWIVRQYPDAPSHVELLSSCEEVEVYRGPIKMDFPEKHFFLVKL
jgi:hypothetical protein